MNNPYSEVPDFPLEFQTELGFDMCSEVHRPFLHSVSEDSLADSIC